MPILFKLHVFVPVSISEAYSFHCKIMSYMFTLLTLVFLHSHPKHILARVIFIYIFVEYITKMLIFSCNPDK